MKNPISILKLCVIVFLFQANNAFAQCSITYSGATCVGEPIVFNCNSIGGSNYNWDFNGEGSNNNVCNPAFSFSTTGIKTITLSMRLSNGSTCSTSLKINIKPTIVPAFRLLSAKTQCPKTNQFCFSDSTVYSADSICQRIFVIDDGSKYTFNGKKPIQFCHSFQDPMGGTYGVTVRYISCSGCEKAVRYNAVCKVYPNMTLNFSSLVPKRCDSLILTVTNNSVVELDSLTSFEWDWGDGTKTTGNPTTPGLWKMQVNHKYKSQGPNGGYFDVTLFAKGKNGCSEFFTFKNAALNINSNPVIVSSLDSTCFVGNSITFSLKDGPVLQGANPLFIFEYPPIPTNINRNWQGSHTFTTPGPHRINFSFTHPIPGCGKSVFDTVLIIGPQSIIQSNNSNAISPNELYQCVVKDTVHFKNISKFYHNDKVFKDDDSTYYVSNGFNAPLGHAFNNNGSLTSTVQKRRNDNIFRVWDFGDDYCEKCTIDTKNGINVNKNCRFSKDEFPKHLYQNWEDIYVQHYSDKFQNINYYSKDSGYTIKRRLFADDTFAIIRDTIIYYGDNYKGKRTKDSVVYSNISSKIKLNGYQYGPSKTDINITSKYYLEIGDTVYVDLHNGMPPTRYIGLRSITLQPGQTLVINNSTDKALLDIIIDYRNDTIPKSMVNSSHKVFKYFKISTNATDSFDAAFHRRHFYESNTVKCIRAKLYQKDIKHPLSCASETYVDLALAPPSAKFLRKGGIQCLGSGSDKYGISFILDEVKPGCGTTWADINFDTKKDPNAWVPAIGKGLSSGQISMGNLPAVNPPFLIFSQGATPGTIFSKVYGIEDIYDQKNGYIDVGLIIGNGIHTNNNYPNECVDTVYYKDFAKFPILDNSIKVISQNDAQNFYKICKDGTVTLTLADNNQTNIRDVGTLDWTITSNIAGKNAKDTVTIGIKETYNRFTTVPNNPSILMDYLTVEKYQTYNGNKKVLSTTTIPIAQVSKWHAEADISEVYQTIKSQLAVHGLNIVEYTAAQIADMIWNGKGTIGKAYSGSRGIIDTTGIGSKIRFTVIADQKTTLHFKDTSALPLDNNLSYTGVNTRSYQLTPKFAGYYTIMLQTTSSQPGLCPSMNTEAKRLIVGFYGALNPSDTIMCHGQRISISPQFRYYDTYPDITFRDVDPVDYWRSRIQEAGNVNREGYTRTDLSKDDDGIDPKSTFGGFPYSITGLDNQPNQRLSISGGVNSLYYNADTGRMYTLRTAAMDSTGCRDTFSLNIYVNAVRPKMSLSLQNQGCSTLVNLIDNSEIQDAHYNIHAKASDKIVKTTIHWGDIGLNSTYSVFDKFPPVSHAYSRGGLYRINLTSETNTGCIDSVSEIVDIKRPNPYFDTLIKRQYCLRDTVKLTNLSGNYSKKDSSIWTWQFDDNTYGNQSDTMTSINRDIKHKYNKSGNFSIVLYQYYKVKVNNQSIYCRVQYPDLDLGEKPFLINVRKCDSTSVDQINSIKSISMYPNPAHNIVTFKSDESCILYVYNSIGDLVEILKLEENIELNADLRHLSKGLYIIRSNNHSEVGKLIID